MIANQDLMFQASAAKYNAQPDSLRPILAEPAAAPTVQLIKSQADAAGS